MQMKPKVQDRRPRLAVHLYLDLLSAITPSQCGSRSRRWLDHSSTPYCVCAAATQPFACPASLITCEFFHATSRVPERRSPFSPRITLQPAHRPSPPSLHSGCCKKHHIL